MNTIDLTPMNTLDIVPMFTNLANELGHHLVLLLVISHLWKPHNHHIVRQSQLRNFWIFGEPDETLQDAPTPHSSGEPRCPVPEPLGDGAEKSHVSPGYNPQVVERRENVEI